MDACFVWCAAGHCSRSTVVFLVYKSHQGWNRIWDSSFANDCVCYRQTDRIEDTSKLQKDIDQLGKLRFQPVKCNYAAY